MCHRVFIMMRSAFAALILAGLAGCADAPQPHGGLVVMGPHITETVFALGLGARVTAVDDYSDFPPEVAALPRVGGYLDPDLERITLIKPELLLLAGHYPKVMDFAGPRGLPTLVVHMDSFATIDAGITMIGQRLGCPVEAERLRASISSEIDAVRAAVRDKPRPKVLIITGRAEHNLDDLHTAGAISFLSEMVDAAGGDNIFLDTQDAYFEASKETVVVRMPEVVLEFHAGEDLAPEERAAFITDWAALTPLPAVQNGRIHLITESHALRPGPRIAEVVRLIARLLHPEAVL